MSFVGGDYKHDIFVSYAHGKDLELVYSDPRRNPLYIWSCRMIDDLRDQIELTLSDSDQRPDVWMDGALKSTGSLEGNLEREIRSSALFLSLISPYYLRSQWCRDEINLFSDLARDFCSVERQDRIFAVSSMPTNRKSWPPALRDDKQDTFLGMQFYRELGPDPDQWTFLGWPDPSKDQDYWTSLKHLAVEITSVLPKMRHAQENRPRAGNAAEVPVFVGRKLLLGYCHDTLARERDRLRITLSSMEMQILPGESDDITDPSSLESSYDQYLEQADAVVLLANEYCGTWPKNEEAGFISLQVRKARELNKRCYMWLNVQDDDKVQTASYNGYIKKLWKENERVDNEKKRALFCGKDVEDFASFVKANLAALDPDAIPRPALLCSNLSTRPYPYKQFQEWVLEVLGDLNYEVTLPPDTGSGQIRLT